MRTWTWSPKRCRVFVYEDFASAGRSCSQKAAVAFRRLQGREEPPVDRRSCDPRGLATRCAPHGPWNRSVGNRLGCGRGGAYPILRLPDCSRPEGAYDGGCRSVEPSFPAGRGVAERRRRDDWSAWHRDGTFFTRWSSAESGGVLARCGAMMSCASAGRLPTAGARVGASGGNRPRRRAARACFLTGAREVGEREVAPLGGDDPPTRNAPCSAGGRKRPGARNPLGARVRPGRTRRCQQRSRR